MNRLATVATVCAPSGDFRPWEVTDPGPCIRCEQPLVLLPHPDGDEWITTHRRQLGGCGSAVARHTTLVEVDEGLFPDPTVRVPPTCCGWPMRYAPRGWNCRINTSTWAMPTFEGASRG